MMHRRIAHHRQFQDILWFEMAILYNPSDQLIQSIDDAAVYLFKAFWMGHGIGDSRHDIFTKGDLRVHHRLGGDHLSSSEVAEIASNGCRSHIDGKTEEVLHSARSDIDNFFLHPDRYSDLPASLSK